MEKVRTLAQPRLFDLSADVSRVPDFQTFEAQISKRRTDFLPQNKQTLGALGSSEDCLTPSVLRFSAKAKVSTARMSQGGGIDATSTALNIIATEMSPRGAAHA